MINHKYHTHVLIVLALIFTGCAERTPPPKAESKTTLTANLSDFRELFNYLNKNNSVSLEALTKRYEICEEISQSVAKKEINLETYRKLNITRKDFQSAVLYKYSTNFESCLGHLQHDMIIHYLRLNAFIVENYNSFSDVEKEQFNMERPYDTLGQISLFLGSFQLPEVKIKLHYESLNADKKLFFDKLFETTPFSLSSYPTDGLPPD